MVRANPADGVREHTLANGLKVLVKEDHTAPLASVWCWYRVGSRHEGPGLTGVSHWCEHMNFKGTTNIPREQIKGIIEPWGGFWNGYTWVDMTAYVETASADALDRMLFIEAERMSACLYHEDDVASERTVIISELEGGENDPDQLLDQAVIAEAFSAHPYRHPVIGWIDDLRSMTREDLHGYYRRHYVPNNATLVVVGDVDATDVFDRAARHFAAIPAATLPVGVAVTEPEQQAERRVVVSRAGSTGYLKLAYHAPAVGDADFFPMLVLDAVLTGAKGLSLWASFRTPPPQRTTRLYRALVDRGLAAGVQGLLIATAEPFLYIVSATMNDGVSLTAAEAALSEELDRVRGGAITDDEVTVARKQLRTRLVFDADSVTNLAHQLGYFETIASWRLLGELLPRIEAVTPADVRRVAATRLNPSRRTVGWFDPAQAPAAAGRADGA